MNLIENEEVNNKSKKTKVLMTIIIISIILLVVVSILLVYMIYDIQNKMVKLTIDTKTITTFSNDMFLFEDNTIYISIKDYAKLVGYEVYNGDHTSEDTNKGYIRNEYEEAFFELDSNKIYKNLLSDKDNEYYDLEKPVKMANNKLYISVEGIQIASNSAIAYDSKKNQFTIFTLPYLTTHYSKQITDSAIVEDPNSFVNQKALLYNMIVVKNASGSYGVRSLDKKEIIGTKYSSIKFVESSKDFIVTTSDRKMGILSSSGETKIQPTYDEVKQIDKDSNLYLVKNNNKYGVITQNGNIVLHLEYDKIGVDISQFANNNIKNQYLLFDKCIAVQRDKKWGLYDKTGKQILPIEYDGLGCTVGTQTSTTSNSVLVIPKYEAIVIEKNKKYGIIDSTGKELLPIVLDSVYSLTNAGQESYYMVQGVKVVDILEYIPKYVIKPEEDNKTNVIPDITENGTSNTTNSIPENVVNSTVTNSMTDVANVVNNEQTANSIPATTIPQDRNTTSNNATIN